MAGGRRAADRSGALRVREERLADVSERDRFDVVERRRSSGTRRARCPSTFRAGSRRGARSGWIAGHAWSRSAAHHLEAQLVALSGGPVGDEREAVAPDGRDAPFERFAVVRCRVVRSRTPLRPVGELEATRARRRWGSPDGCAPIPRWAACRSVRSSSLYSEVCVKSASRSGSAISAGQPDPVDRERFVTGESKRSMKHQLGVGLEAELLGRLGSWTRSSARTSLRWGTPDSSTTWNRLYSDAERALERATVDRRADAARPAQDPVGAELADGVACRVAADPVDLHQLAVGREPVDEVAQRPCAAAARARAATTAASESSRSSDRAPSSNVAGHQPPPRSVRTRS